MTQKAPTKHELKSEATRTALLKAAETIFARDGYDRAQIDEIARASGRTRGAVYAQYKTKEQLFFAVQERRIEIATEAVARLSAGIADDDYAARWMVVRDYFATSHDDTGVLLDLELKLYGLRHPESIEEWQARYKNLFSGRRFLQSLGLTQKAGRSRLEARMHALSGIKSGLALTMQFMPSQLSAKDARLILQDVFEALFPQSEIGS